MTHPAWSPNFEPPAAPRTERMRLDVLGPEVVELDFAALMSSRARLREELQWGDERPWPADDFTLEENLEDLIQHRGEYDRREAYAYTVLDPTGSSCIGCVYFKPHSDGAKLQFWVTDTELATGLEAHLVHTLLGWLGTAWHFPRVWLLLQAARLRSIQVVESLGLSRLEETVSPGHVSYLWHVS